MASVFLRIKVADFDKWKAVFDRTQPRREAETAIGHSVHRDADDPNTVIVALRVRDLATVREFTQSDELRGIMQEAGVQGPPEFWFAEDVEDKQY
jgi:hypothetical protein